jgi:hypothetical protein
MKPSLNSGFSLSNFLLELTSVKSLFKVWTRGASKIKNASSGYLNLEFGWKPFLRDLSQLGDGLLSWDKKLKDYKARMGQPMKSHFVKELDGMKVVKEYTNEEYGGLRVWHDVTLSKVTFRATMRYTYDVPKVQGEFVALRAILDILGLQFDSAVIWEAIPFSFAADWFLGTGDYLQSRRTDFLDSVVKIQDYCYSVTCRIDDSVRFQNLTYMSSSIPLYEMSGMYYHRQPVLPKDVTQHFGVVEVDRYGTKQYVLSAALLGARKRR